MFCLGFLLSFVPAKHADVSGPRAKHFPLKTACVFSCFCVCARIGACRYAAANIRLPFLTLQLLCCDNKQKKKCINARSNLPKAKRNKGLIIHNIKVKSSNPSKHTILQIVQALDTFWNASMLVHLRSIQFIISIFFMLAFSYL